MGQCMSMSIEKGRISKNQLALLIANTILATVILYTPSLLAKEAGQDAWVAVILAALVGLMPGTLLVFLGLRFPEKNMVEYSIDLLGPWAGRLVGLAFGLALLYIASYVVREFGGLLVNDVMPETPLIAFNLVIVVLAAYGVYLGLETFARVNELIFPLFVIILLVIVASAVPSMDLMQLQPAFRHALPDLFKGALLLDNFYFEGAVILMLFPYLRHPERGLPIIYQVSLLLFLPIMAVVIGVLALFGPEETARMVFPVYELAKTVRLAGFLEHIESLVVGIWVTTASLKLMVLYYAGVLILAQCCNLKDYRPLVVPVAFILIALSVFDFTSSFQVRNFLSSIYLLTFIFFLGIPLLLYLVSLFKPSLKGRDD